MSKHLTNLVILLPALVSFHSWQSRSCDVSNKACMYACMYVCMYVCTSAFNRFNRHNIERLVSDHGNHGNLWTIAADEKFLFLQQHHSLKNV